MSLLGDLAKKALGGVLGNQAQPQSGGLGISPATLAALAPMLPMLMKQLGGIDGLLAKFKSAGLGDKFSSWVGTGPNPETSADEVKAALGDHVNEVAQQTGQEPDAVAGGLAALLPGLIDKLTPQGNVPPEAEQHSGLEGLLSGGASGLLGKLLGGA